MPFIEDNFRISLRDKILREVTLNILIHSEYSSLESTTFTIERDRIVARNFNVPYVYGNIDLHNFKPHRKNPHIANVFSQTIMVEELGSGTKRIFKYTPLYAGGQVPEIYEDDYFTIVIPTPFVLSDTNKAPNDTNSDTINGSNDTINGPNDTIKGVNDTIKGTINGGSDTINGSSDTIKGTINGGSDTINGTNDTIKGSGNTIKSTPIDMILSFIREKPKITAVEIAQRLGINRRNTILYLNKLQAEGRIIRVGAKKNGHWEVVEP